MREPDPWPTLFDAAATPAIDHALRTLYTDLDAAVTARGPTCWQSGKCCNFQAYGHRLYVTALEIAWFLRQAGPPAQETPAGLSLPQFQPDTPTCAYQIDGLCSTHAVRPLGCRVFFCQQGTEQWQNELYESFLTRLRELHDQHTLPYRYMEWRTGLDEANAITHGAG